MNTNQLSAPPGVPLATLTIEASPSGPILNDLRPQKVPLQISFTHPEGKPTHARPHGIRWVANGLTGNQWIEIRLDTSFPGFTTTHAHKHLRPWWTYLEKLFPTAMVLPSGAFGWQLTPATPTADSGQAAWDERFELKPRTEGGRPLIRYDIVLVDPDLKQELLLDPDVDVTPDP